MKLLSFLTACMCCCAASDSAWAGAMAPPPPFARRIAHAEAVLVVKVTAIEEKTIKAGRGPDDKNKVEYRIAVVKVEEALIGGMGLTHLKIGLVPPLTFRGSGGIPRTMSSANLTVGQQALVLVNRHPVESFSIIPNFWDMTDSKSPEFKKQVETARKAGKLLADPLASLKAKDSADRLLAAGLLMGRYRVQRPNHRFDAIPAAESAGILHAIADADWGRIDPATGSAAPLDLFRELGLTEADGWRDPGDFKLVTAAAKKWLLDHSDKHRLKGWVPTKGGK